MLYRMKDRDAGGFLIRQPINVETSQNFISRTLILFTIKYKKPSAATFSDINHNINSSFLISVTERLTSVSLH
jgi:hypothetical protein